MPPENRQVPEWIEPFSEREETVEEIPVNLYHRFAEIYDEFGSESFCLSLFAELQELLDYYCLEKGARVLDLACGTGVITLELARSGYQVTAVDLSSDMLKQARQRAQNAGQEIAFVQSDLRAFKLPKMFEAAICTHDSLDHLFDDDDLDAAFERISECLLDRAVFLFDMNCWSGVQHLNGRTTFVETDRCSVVYDMTAVDQSLETNITGFLKKEDGSYQRFSETLFQRCYREEEILERLEDFGFKLLDRIVMQHLKGEPFKHLWVVRRDEAGY